MKKIAFPLLLTFAVLAAGCGGAEDRKAAYMEKGQSLYDQGNYEKARLEFKNVLQIDPKDVPARYALAQTLEKLQDWRGAAGHYLAVIEADPSHKQALSKMGQIYLLGRNIEEAKKLADKLIALDANDPDGLTLEAGIKALNKDREGAIADAKRALEHTPGHVNASALLASLYLQNQQPDESIATLKGALAKDPKNTTIEAILARVYAQLGKSTEAEALFKEIIAQEPAVLGHRLRLAQFQVQQKQLDGAEATLKDGMGAITVDPKEATTAKLAYVEFIAKYRDADRAAKTLDEMIAAEPDNHELRSALGKLYEAANKPEEAKKTYQAIIAREDDPKSPIRLAAKTRLAVVTARSGDRSGARTIVDEVLKDNPRDKDALTLRGTLMLDAGDAGGAIADYRAALKDNPNDVELSRLLAKAHMMNEEPQLALDTLRKAVDAQPADISLRGDLANLYSQQKDLPAAIDALEEVLKIEPNNRSAFEGLFKIHVFQKDWAKAHEVATRLKTGLPNDPVGFYFDGLAYQGEQKLPESVEQFESALAVSPDAVQPLSQLIKSHLAMGQQDVAEQRLQEVIDRNPKNFVARNLLGELALASKRYEEARESFETALTANDKWAILYRNLASTQLAQNNEDAAIATMEKGIEATGGSALLVTGLATYLEKVGKLDQAVAQYERVLKENPKSQLAANNLAMLLIEYKDDEPSRKRARELSTMLADSKEPAFLDTVGWIEHKFGEHQKAVELIEQAVQATPDSAIMRYHLGMAYAALGNDVQAKDNLKQAVEANVEFRGLDEAKKALAKLGG